MISTVIVMLSLLVAPTSQTAVDPPGGIRMFDGYSHEAGGMDTLAGSMTSKRGFLIRYDIGILAGNAVESLDAARIEWQSRQRVGEQVLTVAKTKDDYLVATFAHAEGQPPASFIAEVHSEQDQAEFFLTVLTYSDSSQSEVI